MRSGGLCNKCLEKGHISKECPKVKFQCQKSGCGGNHHTLMLRPTARMQEKSAVEAVKETMQVRVATMEPVLLRSNKCRQDLVMLLEPVKAMGSLWQLLEPERQECVSELYLSRFVERATTRSLRHTPL